MNNNYILKFRAILIIVSVLVTLPRQIIAQDDKAISFGLFEEEDMLNISLSFDIGTFMKEKPEDEYLDAKITIYIGEKDSIYKDIKVSARGNYRRRTCEFPPIMLNFEDIKTGYSDLDDLEKVKLVSHCQDEEIYETYLLREYLVYSIYNIITDYSFRVRLLNVSYYDINYDTLYANKRGFIIEPVNTLEDRFGENEIEDIEITVEAIDNDLLLRLSVFQYLMANSDWYISTMHNLKIFGDADSLKDLIAVPYDFDYTGWVDTHYAIAREDLGLEDIRDRAFYGPCRSEEEYRDVLDYYLELEDNIIDTIKDFEYLNGQERNDLVRFIKSFYKLYRKDEIINILMEPCYK